MGGVRGRLGPPLGAFGRLPEDKKTTFWEDKCFLPTKWAPKGLLDGFGVALGGFWGGFGRVWGEILEDFGSFEHIVGRFWKCLA